MRNRRAGAVIGLLLLLVYGLPLFAPPAARPPQAARAGAGLWERVFPDVPAWWVMGRLACLFAAAGLLAWSIRRSGPLRLHRLATAGQSARDTRWPETSPAQRAALIVALVHASSGLFASRFGRSAEALYFVCLAVPAGVMMLAENGCARRLRSNGRQLLPLTVLPLLWLAWSVPFAWRSPRAASLVDMWLAVERLGAVATGQQKALADSAIPGLTNAYMMLEGVPLLGPGQLGHLFIWLQSAHFFWTAACALAVGVLVRTIVGAAAATVAQAAFLFSPFVLSFPYDPIPIFLGPLCVVVLLLLFLAVHDARSAAALAAFGAVAGFSGRIPQLSPITLLLCGLTAASILRSGRIPWTAAAVAVLSCAASVLPSFPTPQTVLLTAQEFAGGNAQLAGMVTILFGQQTVRAAAETLHAARTGILDVPLGALLAPFAIARTPMRLWGDVLFDPVGTALMATGLALCVVHATRSRAAVVVLVLLVAGVAPALVSGGDAVSHTRLSPAVLPLVLLAGVGFEALRQAFAAPLRPQVVAAFTAALIATAGIAIFEWVNPQILPASSLAISLEALDTPESNADAVVLEHGNVEFLHVRRISTLLPARSVRALAVQQFQRLEVATAGQQVYFWSPGLEQDMRVSCVICGKWPGAAFYTLTDKPGLFGAFAASPQGANWNPRLPQKRWTVSFCGAPICQPDTNPWPTSANQHVLHCSRNSMISTTDSGPG